MSEPINPSMSQFRAECRLALERVAFVAALLAAAAVAMTVPAVAGLTEGSVLLGVGTLAALAVLFLLLAQRWEAEWLVYGTECALVGAYLYRQYARPLPETLNALLLVLFCFLDFGLSQAMERQARRLYARPTLLFSLVMPLLPLLWAVARGQWDQVGTILLFSTATFYGVVGYEKQWKGFGYLAGLLYNAALWLVWARIGWQFAAQPQLYLIPAGLSAILFAEANREELGRESVNAIRAIGSMVIYLSTAVPMWQFHSFGAWLTLLLLSLLGIFAGIGLRVQAFLWLGLFCFLFDVLYQVGRFGVENALGKWAVMLALGIALILFVALTEKKRLMQAMRDYYEEVRRWD
jgi:hypothetical protein